MNAREYKQALLDALYKPYQKCIACPLGGLGRKKVVFGSGNPDAQLLLIGEGPGQEEDAQGLPFVGRSGKLLTKILHAFGIDRNDIYITNVVKCRPPNNRKPTLLESSTCKNLLLFNQIKIIRPKIICTLGASALEGLLDKSVSISQLRGKIMHFDGIAVLPTYHPAYILRNATKLPDMMQDMEIALSYLKQAKQ